MFSYIKKYKLFFLFFFSLLISNFFLIREISFSYKNTLIYTFSGLNKSHLIKFNASFDDFLQGYHDRLKRKKIKFFIKTEPYLKDQEKIFLHVNIFSKINEKEKGSNESELVGQIDEFISSFYRQKFFEEFFESETLRIMDLSKKLLNQKKELEKHKNHASQVLEKINKNNMVGINKEEFLKRELRPINIFVEKFGEVSAAYFLPLVDQVRAQKSIEMEYEFKILKIEQELIFLEALLYCFDLISWNKKMDLSYFLEVAKKSKHPRIMEYIKENIPKEIPYLKLVIGSKFTSKLAKKNNDLILFFFLALIVSFASAFLLTRVLTRYVKA